ncbi:Cell division cycle protein 20 like protein, partial [Termitomyces sp. T112]
TRSILKSLVLSLPTSSSTQFLGMDSSSSSSGSATPASAAAVAPSASVNVPRKRLLSLGDEPESASASAYLGGPTLRKRARVSSISAGFQNALRGVSSLVNSSTLDRFMRTRSIHTSELDLSSIGISAPLHHPRPLSSASSFTTASRACSPGPDDGLISRSGMALMRSVSSASLASTPVVPTYPECSAKYYMRNTKVTWDFSAPSGGGAVMSCSGDNVVFFSRGDRVHYKNIATGEEVGQLLRLREGDGDLRVLKCAPGGGLLAVGTSTGLIQLWDIKARKKVVSWMHKKTVSAMAWNGDGGILTIGGEKGTIRHYDTRIGLKNISGMKEQARKVTRHQGCITVLEWNVDGRIWASGDSSGTVYCWDGNGKERVPLDVGEFVQRRKKMQHGGAISALAFCPWQPRLLATGDVEGVMQLWNVNPLNQHSNATTPGKLELGVPITSIHFSPHCKEILTTHSCKLSPSSPSNSAITNNNTPTNLTNTNTRTRTTRTTSTRTAPNPLNTNAPLSLPWPCQTPPNAIVIHAYPSLRHVTTLIPSLSVSSSSSSHSQSQSPSQTPGEEEGGDSAKEAIVGSVMNGAGTRIVVANG